jgi:hemoglobin-like flavoprotein
MSLNVEVLEKSFERVKPQANDFAFSFYQNLLTDYPQLRPLFAKTNMEEQQQKLMMSLVLVIENLRNPNYLKIILKNLGERHVSYGAIEQHYPMVGAALLKTFESYLGADWTLEVKQAWIDAYGVLVDLMLEGAKNPETISPMNNVVGRNDKAFESSKPPTQAPAATSSVNYSQGTSKFENFPQLSDPKQNFKPSESSKAPTQAFTTTSSVNYSQETPKLENFPQLSDLKPNVKPSESSKPSTQTTATTSILNRKVLLIVAVVIAGLLGVGFFYSHSNSKQDNGSLTSSAGKTT